MRVRGTHFVAKLDHLLAERPAFAQQGPKARPVLLAFLIETGVEQTDCRLGRKDLEPLDVQRPRRVFDTKRGTVQAQHSDRPVTNDQREHEDGLESGALNTFGVERSDRRRPRSGTNSIRRWVKTSPATPRSAWISALPYTSAPRPRN